MAEKACWICDQKTAWREEALQKAECDAKERSKNTGKTYLVAKVGALYQVYENGTQPEGVEALSYHYVHR
jgi:hypothetical protein